MPPTDFWATSAQTMPVLGLALVVEARVIMRGWEPGRDAVWKSIQGSLWGLSLLIYAFAEPACFRALAGEQVWSGWPTLIQAGVQVGSTALIVAPAIEFIIRANARIFVRLSPSNLQSYRSVVGWLRLSPRLRRAAIRQDDLQQRSVRLFQLLASAEAAAQEIADPDARARALDELAERRAELTQVREDMRKTQQDLIDLNTDFEVDRAEFRRRRKIALEAAEAAVEQWNHEVAKPIPTEPHTDTTPDSPS
jgi:hypothetical protein